MTAQHRPGEYEFSDNEARKRRADEPAHQDPQQAIDLLRRELGARVIPDSSGEEPQ